MRKALPYITRSSDHDVIDDVTGATAHPGLRPRIGNNPTFLRLQHKGSSGDSRLSRRDENHDAGEKQPETDDGQAEHRDGERRDGEYESDIGEPARQCPAPQYG